MEVLFHDGIVRAAEDQVFDLFARENVVDLRTDLGVNVVLVEVAAVNECREQGRALADDLALGITLMDELGVLAEATVNSVAMRPTLLRCSRRTYLAASSTMLTIL